MAEPWVKGRFIDGRVKFLEGGSEFGFGGFQSGAIRVCVNRTVGIGL